MKFGQHLARNVAKFFFTQAGLSLKLGNTSTGMTC